MIAHPTTPPATPRARNSAETRAAILEAARRQFAQASYDSVGVRDLAAEVGVDKALVNRYFGSKEELFREALEGNRTPPQMNGAPADISRRLASDTMARMADGSTRDSLSMILRSMSSPAASQIVRQALIGNMIEPLAKEIGGDADAEMRACLAVAVSLGVTVLAQLLSLPAISQAECDRVEARIATLVRTALIDSAEA